MTDKQLTEKQEAMYTIAKAIRILSNGGMLDIKIGKTVIPACHSQSKVGPLTPAVNNQTGEDVFLIADSGLTVGFDGLKFTMEYLSE
jgi:hypothetical protein